MTGWNQWKHSLSTTFQSATSNANLTEVVGSYWDRKWRNHKLVTVSFEIHWNNSVTLGIMMAFLLQRKAVSTLLPEQSEPHNLGFLGVNATSGTQISHLHWGTFIFVVLWMCSNGGIEVFRVHLRLSFLPGLCCGGWPWQSLDGIQVEHPDEQVQGYILSGWCVIRMAHRLDQQDNLHVHERVWWCCPTLSTSALWQWWDFRSFGGWCEVLPVNLH